MKPFGFLVAERSADLEHALEMSNRFLQRYRDISSSKQVTLEEVSWIAAVLYLGLQQAISMASKNESVDENGSRVVTVVATSEMKTSDEIN